MSFKCPYRFNLIYRRVLFTDEPIPFLECLIFGDYLARIWHSTTFSSSAIILRLSAVLLLRSSTHPVSSEPPSIRSRNGPAGHRYGCTGRLQDLLEAGSKFRRHRHVVSGAVLAPEVHGDRYQYQHFGLRIQRTFHRCGVCGRFLRIHPDANPPPPTHNV